MPLDPSFVGRTLSADRRPTRSAGRRSASSPRRSAPTDPAYHDPEAARALGLPRRGRPADVPDRAHRWPRAGRSSTTRRSASTTAGWCTATSGSRYTRPVRGRRRAGLREHASRTISSRGGHDFLTTRTEVDHRRPASRSCTVWSKLVVRGEALTHGASAQPQTFRVTRADLVRYAGASGDFNPIHWSDRVATTVGLPGVIAHGMFTMAWPAGRSPTGPARPTRWSSTACASPGRWSCRTTTRAPRSRSPRVVREVTEDGLTRLDLTATCRGEKVLSQARATVRTAR